MDCSVCKASPAKFKWWPNAASTPQLVCSPLCVYLEHIGGPRGQEDAELKQRPGKQRTWQEQREVEDAEERERLVAVIDNMLQRVERFIAEPSNDVNKHKFRLVQLQNVGDELATDPQEFFGNLREELLRVRTNVVSGGAQDLTSLRARISNELDRILAFENRLPDEGLLGTLSSDLRHHLGSFASPIQEVFRKTLSETRTYTYFPQFRLTADGFLYGRGGNHDMRPDSFTADNKLVQSGGHWYGTTWKYPNQVGAAIKLTTPSGFDAYATAVDSFGNTFGVNTYFYNNDIYLSSEHGECKLGDAKYVSNPVLQFEEYAPGQMVLLISSRTPRTILVNHEEHHVGMAFFFSLETLRGITELAPQHVTPPIPRQSRVLDGMLWSVDGMSGVISVMPLGTATKIASLQWIPSYAGAAIILLSADHKNHMVHTITVQGLRSLSRALGAGVTAQATSFRLAK